MRPSNTWRPEWSTSRADSIPDDEHRIVRYINNAESTVKNHSIVIADEPSELVPLPGTNDSNCSPSPTVTGSWERYPAPG